jgi:hypothetical protein
VKTQIGRFLLLLALLASSVSAFADTSELDAVERHCGAPGAESKETSNTNGQLQRTLIYKGVLYLHFEPAPGGWGFTTAWNNHLPMTRAELERRLPCFRNAMQEADSTASSVDPTIASQTAANATNDATFGIPHFALIVFLTVTLLVFLILPSARQRQLEREKSKPIEHIYRKPNMEEYILPPTPPVPITRNFD